MGFLMLLGVASMPIIQVLLISLLGAFMATDYLNLLPSHARKSLNTIVFIVFTPSLMFASLAETVTFQDLVAWWFMPINVGLTFLFGGILGWIAVKIVKPEPHLEGLIMATCSSGNLGNLLLIIVPATCSEEGSPFSRHKQACRSVALSYASFSMALGGFYIWTYTYQLVRNSGLKYKALLAAEELSKAPNNDLEANQNTSLLHAGEIQKSTGADTENQVIVSQVSASKLKAYESGSGNIIAILYQVLEELLAPPTLGAIIGFLFGAVPFLKNLIIGDNAPLRVIQDTITILGNGTIPCITLILGGNLTQGLRSAKLKPKSIAAVVCVRYVFLPMIGIGIVKSASSLGLLPSDPLFHFVLMVQYAVPPAMNIGTMCQLFDVAQEECSVLFLWTYAMASFALTVWSTVFMSIL